VTGFPGGHGWNGCLTLPRQLSLSRSHESADSIQLRQEPAPQLSKRRGEPVKWRNLSLTDQGEVLSLPKTNTLEILARVDMQKATAVTLEIKSSGNDAQPIKIHFDGSELAMMESKAPLKSPKGKLSLRVFLDRSVLEVFANETVCFTKRINPLAADPTMTIRAESGSARADLVEAWPMKPIW